MLLGERPNSSQLKSFSINGLFGYKDVEIPFDKEALILIGENGSGKTTILNTLYYSISCQFHKLSNVEFESVILEFTSGVTIEIKKSYLNSFEEPEPLIKEAREIFNFAFNVKKEIDYTDKINEFITTIKEKLKEKIWFFPTYRRIEKELKNLGYEDDRFEQLSLPEGEDNLIQFGMNDVIEKLDEIKNTIKNSALNLFSKVTGEMLTQFVDGIEITEEMRNRIQPDTLKIVLSRVGENNISKSVRYKIEELVKSGNINDDKYNQLVYFLSKLLGLYEQQKEKEDSLNQFALVCNNYLYKKSIVYDEANVDIYIIEIRNNSRVNFSDLSSGEKQIISIFSKIYLEPSEDFILLFDEPELSLSLEWQRLLLPDILKSGKCKLLLAATHSPFIFDNELDLNAQDLDTFVKER